jgi:hypothetical protein
MSELQQHGSTPYANVLFERLHEYLQVGRAAAEVAQEENRTLGIPNVYSMNGKIFYELPDGTITDVQPEIYKQDFSSFGAK